MPSDSGSHNRKGGYPYPSSTAVTAVMKGNRRTDTKPESQLRSELHRRGFRFRKDLPIDVGERRRPRPDIVFPRHRVAVFVDGCFWHRCPEHGRVPTGNNSEYWGQKLQRNQERDARDTQVLEQAGWTVLRVWEHVAVADAADRVSSALLRHSDNDGHGGHP